MNECVVVVGVDLTVSVVLVGIALVGVVVLVGMVELVDMVVLVVVLGIKAPKTQVNKHE